MNIPSFRAFQPFLFSILVVALLAAKLHHLFQHARSIPLLRFVVYFPTFFIQDCFIITVQRLLLHGQSRNTLSILGLSIGAFLAYGNPSLTFRARYCDSLGTNRFLSSLGPSPWVLQRHSLDFIMLLAESCNGMQLEVWPAILLP